MFFPEWKKKQNITGRKKDDKIDEEPVWIEITEIKPRILSAQELNNFKDDTNKQINVIYDMEFKYVTTCTRIATYYRYYM